MKRIVFLLIPLLLLTGCGYVYEDNIYTICLIDKDATYVFNDDDFFKVVDGNVITADRFIINKEPALLFKPEYGSYDFTEDIPGLYHGTFEQLEHYIMNLIDSDNCSYTIEYSDSEFIEINVHSSTYSGRLSFNIKGEIRMYFINNSGNSISPPYINSNSNNYLNSLKGGAILE